ncbi:Coq4-domain-containing protein [Wolfiporia cocos MD-104 SS10]|uniref:Coq4-domain-containing protein n=1 Tax=Wolfiporia cocos (strain MD-104) TaxID=742152 RepID=A0A2H3J5Z1_WOLCO|nr:Coq4-domain-containing protein [Wolfiporia cocos MD-104 SS10]
MSVFAAVTRSTTRPALRACAAASNTCLRPVQTRSASTQPAYEGHIPLNWFEPGFLTVGSAVMSLVDPRRGAALGDVASGPVLPRLRDFMLESPEGRKIFKQRPCLALLPQGTFRRAYVTWLEHCGVTLDTREPVHYVDDPELGYVLQRYRECYDFYHCMCGLPLHL